MEEKKRSQADPAYCWDLSAVFEDKAAWEAALKEASSLTGELTAIAGTLGASREALKKGLDRYYEINQKAEIVYIYAMLNAAVDNGDDEAQDMQARATRMVVELSAASSFLCPEILAIDPEELEKWLASDELAGYRHIIDDVTRARAHTLSPAEEKLLAMLGDAAQAPSDIFDMFESVDMRFAPLDDGRSLTHALFGVYRDDADKGVRREAFEKYFGEYQKYNNTIAAMYAGSVKLDSFHARARNHEGALAAALFSNNVPVSLYENLIACIHEAIPTLDRYLKLRKRILGLNELSMYDLYVPLIGEVDAKISYDEAQKMVLNAVRPLGDEYASLIGRAFSEKWIDVYENAGKTTGAFSCGVYGVHPYVLLNYTDRLDDAFTVAHELGHSMHSWFSSQKQDFANHDYSIFVAEVASTVNEVLLTRHLLSIEKDPAKRAFILNHLLEGFRTTVFRQTLFAEFEMQAHAMYERGESLTAQALNRLYHELNETYYPEAAGTDKTDVEWSRIPHFYNAFYVYQYATGFCSAVAIADRILNHGGAKDYLEFLSTGGSMYPIDELKIAGVDLTAPEAIRSAMKVFEETLDEFEALMTK